MHPAKKRFQDFIAERLPVVSQNSDPATVRNWLDESGGEFCHSFHFTQKILDRFCYAGFLPMSVDVLGTPLLSLKLHLNRVLLPPSGIRAKKNILSKFAGHELSVDRDFDGCLRAIHAFHRDSWLAEPLTALYRRSNASGGKRVRLHSVELRDGGELVAGEIGYTVGSCYTSLTGFHTVSSSGTAQLYALGMLLEREGFRLWDMGMYAPYKLDIGGKLHSRNSFLDILASVRDDRIVLRPETVFVRDLRAANPIVGGK